MLEIITEDLKIINLTPQIGIFRLTKPEKKYTGFDNNYLILDLGEKKKGDFATCNFIFESEEFKITSTGSSCGCTNPSFQTIDGKQMVTVVFNPNLIKKDIDKWFTLYFNNDMLSQLKINLLINS